MSRAGRMDQMVAFDAPTQVHNGQGGRINGWTQLCVVAANIRYLRGSEPVIAARLSGKQPVVVTVRKSSLTAQITTAFRMRDTRTGAEYNIRGIVPTADRAAFEITAESGVAV